MTFSELRNHPSRNLCARIELAFSGNIEIQLKYLRSKIENQYLLVVLHRQTSLPFWNLKDRIINENPRAQKIFSEFAKAMKIPSKIWRRFSNSRKSRDYWCESTELHSPLIVIACRDRCAFLFKLEKLLNWINFKFKFYARDSSCLEWFWIEAKLDWSEMLMQNFQTQKWRRTLSLKFLRV